MTPEELAAFVQAQKKKPTRMAELLVPIIIACLATVPPTIIALATLNASQHAAAKADNIEVRTEKLITKADEIHVLANSAKTKADSALDVANESIKRLELLNAVLVGAARPAPPAPTVPPPVPQAAPVATPPAVVP